MFMRAKALVGTNFVVGVVVWLCVSGICRTCFKCYTHLFSVSIFLFRLQKSFISLCLYLNQCILYSYVFHSHVRLWSLNAAQSALKVIWNYFAKKKKIIRKNEITANACWVKERTNTTNESCIKNFCSLFSVRRLGSHRHCIRKKPEKFHVDTHQSHLFHSLAEDQSKAKLKMHSIFFVFLV